MPPIPRPIRRDPDRESDILVRIRNTLALMADVTIFRNNVGVLRDSRGIPIRFGLAVGSADLVGSIRLTCRTMDGTMKTIARPLAIEVKMPGQKPRPEQKAWLKAMTDAGWVTGVCTSPEQAIELVVKARRWEV